MKHLWWMSARLAVDRNAHVRQVNRDAIAAHGDCVELLARTLRNGECFDELLPTGKRVEVRDLQHVVVIADMRYAHTTLCQLDRRSTFQLAPPSRRRLQIICPDPAASFRAGQHVRVLRVGAYEVGRQARWFPPATLETDRLRRGRCCSGTDESTHRNVPIPSRHAACCNSRPRQASTSVCSTTHRRASR